MIRVQCRGIIGIYLGSRVDQKFIKDCLEFFGKKPKRIAFVDKVLSTSLAIFIGELFEAGHDVAGFYDHHWIDDPRSDVSEGMNCRLDILSSVEHLVMTTREESLSATELVEHGEWQKRKIQIVFFDKDMDGFLGFLRGCGVNYASIVNDARAFDAPGAGYTLSPLGLLLFDLQFLSPHKDSNRDAYSKTHREYLISFIRILEGQISKEESEAFNERVCAAKKRANDNAVNILENAIWYPGGLVLFDCAPINRSGEHVCHSLLKRKARQLFVGEGEVKAFAFTYIGELDRGVRVCVAINRRAHKKISMFDVRGRTSSSEMRHMNLDEFGYFVKNWEDAVARKFGYYTLRAG